jgi:hypothetical protein
MLSLPLKHRTKEREDATVEQAHAKRSRCKSSRVRVHNPAWLFPNSLAVSRNAQPHTLAAIPTLIRVYAVKLPSFTDRCH